MTHYFYTLNPPFQPQLRTQFLLLQGSQVVFFNSIPTGLDIDSTTGEINLTNSVPNTYTITYTVANICANSSNISILVIDDTPPIASITSAESNPTANSSFEITINFDEDINNFSLNDIIVDNGTISNFSGGGLSYQATVTAITTGTVTVYINPGSFTDLYGNENTVLTEFMINFDNTLSVNDENPLERLTIYPIPSKNTINISGELNLKLESVEFYDIQGKLIFSKILDSHNTSNSIDISSFRSGFYLMKIFSETSTIAKKIIKE